MKQTRRHKRNFNLLQIKLKKRCWNISIKTNSVLLYITRRSPFPNEYNSEKWPHGKLEQSMHSQSIHKWAGRLTHWKAFITPVLTTFLNKHFWKLLGRMENYIWNNLAIRRRSKYFLQMNSCLALTALNAKISSFNQPTALQKFLIMWLIFWTSISTF